MQVSQLTTAFHTGARVVLLNYLFPKDVPTRSGNMASPAHRGAAALDTAHADAGAEGSYRTLRYLANTGGRMPEEHARCNSAPVRPRPRSS